MVVQKLDANAT